jgi:colicin import membrane protein
MSDVNSKKTRPWYQKKRFAIPLVLLVLGLISAQNAPLGEQTSSPGASQQPTALSNTQADPNESQEPADESVEAELDSEDRADDGSSSLSETSEQRNARESAESYLRFHPFSRTGLIQQLEYEGYSFEDSSYAVDAVNADWFEQAAKSAESYLEFSSFSRSGLLDQLLYEGFTEAEAAYGVKEAYGGEETPSGVSADQANAIGSAESYLRYSAFSRTGLIAQLEYEGFSLADSTYAVDALNIDWFEQAVKSAETYLEYSSFSRQGLYDQLIYEGFLPGEAEFGVNVAY